MLTRWAAMIGRNSETVFRIESRNVTDSNTPAVAELYRVICWG